LVGIDHSGSVGGNVATGKNSFGKQTPLATRSASVHKLKYSSVCKKASMQGFKMAARPAPFLDMANVVPEIAVEGIPVWTKAYVDPRPSQSVQL